MSDAVQHARAAVAAAAKAQVDAAAALAAAEAADFLAQDLGPTGAVLYSNPQVTAYLFTTVPRVHAPTTGRAALLSNYP